MYTKEAWEMAEQLFQMKEEDKARLADILNLLVEGNMSYSYQDFDIKQHIAGIITKGLNK
jgi:hypothetical protein